MSQPCLLVTGAAGFTGRHLINQAKQHGYRCIAIGQPGGKDLTIADKTCSADVLDSQQVEAIIQQFKPDYVVHLAAMSFVAHGNPSEIYRVNQLGTLNLLDAVRRHRPTIKKVLIASSANIYGNATVLPITEAAQPDPINHYGVSKVAMELIAQLYADLPIVITRPFNYTGCGQATRFLIPKLVDAFWRKQETIELGNLSVSRDISDVRDVVRAYLKLLTHDTPERVYNVCSGLPTSLLSVVDMLNDLAGYRIQVKVSSDFVRKDEIITLYGSPASLEFAIGCYREFTLEQTLAWMLGQGKKAYE